MKTRSEITKSISLRTDTDTLLDAMAFVLEAADEVGNEVNVSIDYRILPGEEEEKKLYYSVRVVGNTFRPQMLGNENE